MKPVKLFVILDTGNNLHCGDVEKLLESNFGPVDHRISLSPNDPTFLSFDRLVDLADEFPVCASILTKIAAGSRAGFLQNHRVVLSAEELLHFKNGQIELQPGADPGFASPTVLNFFSEVRVKFRQQLRAMCLLRGQG